MSFVILGDLHAGESDGNLMLMDHQLQVLDEVIQYCTDNKINNIVATGDVFDVRKSTNTNVLNTWKTRFFDKLKELSINFHTIVGNHDMYYKNAVNPNTITQHLLAYENVFIYDIPSKLKIDGTNILMMPWICSSNYDDCIEALNNKKQFDAVIGHFEINNVSMGGSICNNGLPQSFFINFKTVISGHFHIKGKYSNIEYVGTPYEMSWIDYNEPKGFHLFDDKLEFIQLDHKLYHRIYYNDEFDLNEKINLENKFVKVSIDNRTDFKKYDKFIHAIEQQNPYSLTIIEPLMDLSADDVNMNFNGDLVVKATEDLISDYISELYPEKYNNLNNLIQNIHQEARVL